MDIEIINHIKEKVEANKKLADESKLPEEFEVNPASLDYDTKKELLRYMLTEDNITNLFLINNIKIITTSKISLNKDIFSATIFSSMEELFDLREDLLPEIVSFNQRLAKYYLGALKSLIIAGTDTLIEKDPIPYTYQGMLLVTDFYVLSGCLADADINIKDVPYVFFSEKIIESLAGKTFVANNLKTLFAKPE